MSAPIALIDRVPDSLDIESDGSKHLVRVLLARSQDWRYLSLVVTLVYPSSSLPAELKFDFVVESLDDSFEAFRTMDRGIVRRFIPGELIELVMPIVGACYVKLLDEFKPKTVQRVTKARRPCERQLAKHVYVNSVLSSCGYLQHEAGTDKTGRAFWIHVKGGEGEGTLSLTKPL